MEYVFILIFAEIAFFERKRVKFLLNPLTIFLLEWSVILIFSKLHLYKLEIVKSTTYITFIAGIISYIVGYYFLYYFKQKCKFQWTLRKKSFVIRYKLINALGIICFIYYLFYLVIVAKSLSSFNLWAVQQYLRDNEEIISNPWIRALESFIFGPVSFAIPIIGASDIWFGEKNKKLLLITMSMLIVQTLATASRMTLLLFIIYVALIGIYKLKAINLLTIRRQKKKIRKWMCCVCVIGILAFIVMSLSRGLSLFKSFYLQISIPPLMYEKWKEEVDAMKLYGFSEASLNGFFFPIFYIFQKVMGFKQLPSNMQVIYDLINLTDSQWIMVGTNIPANAYVSIFWFLYTDARYLGIVLGMFLFGIYCANSYLKLKKDINFKTVSLYCVCIVAVLFTLVRMQFARAKFCLAIAFIQLVAFHSFKTRKITQII